MAKILFDINGCAGFTHLCNPFGAHSASI